MSCFEELGHFAFLIHTAASARCQSAALIPNRFDGLQVLGGSCEETVETVPDVEVLFRHRAEAHGVNQNGKLTQYVL